MSNYSRKTVMDYVNGNDIGDHDIEELEDNYEFMIDVIEFTNDKNMYNMCSDRVKKSYEFVKFMVNKFSSDSSFICEVADEYLDNASDDLARIELLIIMSSLLPKDNEHFLVYKVQLEGVYLATKFNIGLLKKQPAMEYEAIEGIIQYGFWIILDDYNSSDIIMKYFAKRFIDDIIDEFKIDLEKKLHKDFRSFEDVEAFGINNYLINLISMYDSNLSAYVSCHLELLDDLKKRMNSIKKRWDFYSKEVEAEKYRYIIERVHQYIEEHELECSIPEIEMLYYIGRELGIADKIAEYDGIDTELYEDVMSSFDGDSSISEAKKRNDLNELKHYLRVKRIITDILLADGDDDGQPVRDDDKSKKVKPNCRILKFIPKGTSSEE